MKNEIWKNIWGYGGKYQVSNFGRVRKIHILKQRTDQDGYKDVKLNKENKQKTYFVHRLVAKSFISNPNNKPQVNHIDGNPANNQSENLEWVTASENTKHAWEYGLINPENFKGSKKKQIVCSNGREYKGIYEAADELGLSRTLIWKVLKGKRRTTGGYSFWYKEVFNGSQS